MAIESNPWGKRGVDEPSMPYLLFHPKFVVRHENKWWENQMYQGVFALGWFKEPCFAIDVECRRFPLLDVVDNGLVWSIGNILPGRGGHGRRLHVEFIFGPPTQMTFDDVRELYVERIVAMRRASQNGETPAQFCARNANYTDVKEFIESVGLMGKWPVAEQRKLRKKK